MNPQKKLAILAIVSAVIIIGSSIFAWRVQKASTPRTAQDQIRDIMNHGVDYSHSTFTPDQTDTIKQAINDRVASFENGKDFTASNLVSIADKARDVGDNDTALAIFAVVDTMNPKDLFYKIDVGNIYLSRQQWEEARQVFEPMKVTWPVQEAYLGLAEAYKHIDGTPDYVIDQIYEESLYRNSSPFEVLQAYAEWLEKTGREDKSLQYYEQMEQIKPQPILENKIKELKAKYPKAA